MAKMIKTRRMPPVAGRAAKTQAITVMLADGHAIVREGVRRLLESSKRYQVIAECANGEDVVRLAGERRPDLLLVELSLPGADGLQILQELARSECGTRVVVLTGSVLEIDIDVAFQSGAHAIVFKEADSQTQINAIETVMRGGRWLRDKPVLDNKVDAPAPHRRFGLSDRELEVLRAACRGDSNKEIAIALSISDQTVKHHLTKIFAKAAVSGRSELFRMAVATGLTQISWHSRELHQ